MEIILSQKQLKKISEEGRAANQKDIITRINGHLQDDMIIIDEITIVDGPNSSEKATMINISQTLSGNYVGFVEYLESGFIITVNTEKKPVKKQFNYI